MPKLERQADSLARIYARSLFDMASEQGGQKIIESTLGELEAVVEFATEIPAFSEFLTSQILSTEKRGASLRTMFKGRISDVVLNFLLVLNEKGRLDRIATIASAYDELLQKHFGRVEVDVFTAEPIDKKLVKTITDRLREVLSKEPIVHQYTDASMLGGLKLRIGDQLIDNSVSTQLRRIQERLRTTGNSEIQTNVERLFDDAG
ncbi:MAG: ATP synthase F1 subunit delta [Planctomycetota bacterium]|jgi:F-type H+-transporting ATPase subunit delta